MRALCIPLFTLLVTATVARAQEAETPPPATESTATEAAPVESTPAVVETVPTAVAAYVPMSGPQLPEFHGYATQGFVLSDHNNYYQSRSNRGSARLTEVALNISDALTDRLRVVVQMSAILSDEFSDMNLRLDFGFADYHFADQLGVRVGRFRQLAGLYSEVWDTDIARTPIFLPTAVYNPSGRSFALAANGIQLYGRTGLGAVGGLSYAASVGGMKQDNAVDVTLAAVGRMIYETPIDGLRLGAAVTIVQINIPMDIGAEAAAELVEAGIAPASFTGAATLSARGDDSVTVPNVFIEYATGNLTLAAEYSRTTATPRVQEAFLEGIIPPSKLHSDGFYVLGSYRFTDWFTLGGYGSFAWADYYHRSTEPAKHTFDYAVTTRFDLNSFAAFKLEGHHINGTSQLNAELNPGTVTDSGWLFAARLSAAF